ncbi:MAG: uridine kinase [Bacteriovoracia bacterium]
MSLPKAFQGVFLIFSLLGANAFAQIPTHVIFIGGGSASGKSTVAVELKTALEKKEKKVTYITLDHYFDPLAQPKELYIDGTPNYDHPSAVRFNSFREDLNNLLAGKLTYAPKYDFTTLKVADNKIPLRPADFLIVDGIHALSDESLSVMASHPNIAASKVFIRCNTGVRNLRRAKRDLRERSCSNDFAREYNRICFELTRIVNPMFDQFIAPTQAKASLVVEGTHRIDDIVKTIIEHLHLPN